MGGRWLRHSTESRAGLWRHRRLPTVASRPAHWLHTEQSPPSSQPAGTTGRKRKMRGRELLRPTFDLRMPPHALVDGVRARLHALPTAACASSARGIMAAAALLRVADGVFLRQHGCLALRQWRRRTRRRWRRRWRQRWRWWRRIKSVSYVPRISRGLGGDGWPGIPYTASKPSLAPTLQRVGRRIGKACAVGGRLAGLPALLHRPEATQNFDPRVAIVAVPAVPNTQSN